MTSRQKLSSKARGLGGPAKVKTALAPLTMQVKSDARMLAEFTVMSELQTLRGEKTPQPFSRRKVQVSSGTRE